MGRINAWETAINVAQDRFAGGGFDMHSPSVFARYAPEIRLAGEGGVVQEVQAIPRAMHSIYFQILGDHGFLGLALFLLLWILVWRDASWIIRQSRSQKELQWASDLARMIQVSLVGYFVGGAFLSLAYYDVPYNLIVALVVARVLIEKEVKGAAQKEGLLVQPQMNGSKAQVLPADKRR